MKLGTGGEGYLKKRKKCNFFFFETREEKKMDREVRPREEKLKETGHRIKLDLPKNGFGIAMGGREGIY